MTSNHLSVKCRAFLAVAACSLALPGTAGAGVQIWFSAAGKPTPVVRSGTTIQAAVEQLLEGPTAAERGRGVRSAVPRRTPLRSVSITRRIVTVDLGARFAAGRDEAAFRCVSDSSFARFEPSPVSGR